MAFDLLLNLQAKNKLRLFIMVSISTIFRKSANSENIYLIDFILERVYCHR